MFYGILAASGVVLLTDAEHGKPVVECAGPSGVPDGYREDWVWVDTGEQLLHVRDVVPVEGTPEEAALELSRLQFQSLPDAAAYEFRALAEEYVDGMTCHGEGNAEGMPVTRCRYVGRLFRFIGDGVQVMQPGWNPVDAPSLWAEILPGQDGKVGPWVRPGSTNGYSEGDQVTWNGHLWTSIVNNNVDEPGTDNGFRWRDDGPAEGGEA